MDTSFLLYVFSVLFSALLTAGMAIFAWRRRDVPGAMSFTMIMVAVSIWSVAIGLVGISHTPEHALFWYKLRFLSVATLPPLLLIFVLQFTGWDGGLTRQHLALFFLIPLVTQGIIWGKSELFSQGVIFKQTGRLMTIESDANGPWFYVHLGYSILCLLAAFTCIVASAVRASQVHRRQVVALLAGALPPIIVSLIMSTFFSTSSALLMPLSFAIMGLFHAWALFRYRLLDLLPVAQSTLIKVMNDGLLVIDNQHRIIEVNPAAEFVLKIRAAEVIGKNTNVALSNYPQILDRFWNATAERSEVEMGEGENRRFYDLRITPIMDTQGRLSARLVIFRDITDLALAIQQMEMQLREIEALQDELQEQAIHDPLTNLYNRRYLDETLERELARARREGYPVSLVMIDLDYFKNVNDRYGHNAGDLVLQRLALLLQKETRLGDIVCRFGGEEFLLVLPNSSKEFSYKKAEQWRITFQNTMVRYQGAEIQATLSMGVAVFPEHGSNAQDVIHAADQAMYAAKARGRNRVEVWNGHPSHLSQPERSRD